MRKACFLVLLFFGFLLLLSSSRKPAAPAGYISFYNNSILEFRDKLSGLIENSRNTNSISQFQKNDLLDQIKINRLALKKIDFWIRYFEPIAYRRINGPLPVEWETEVFEKFEAPYRREGAGLTLAALYLEEDSPSVDSFRSLLNTALEATNVYLADSITKNLGSYHHFFLANRLFILNLAAIYTTGFECPDTSLIIPELVHTLQQTRELYKAFEENFPGYGLTSAYHDLFDRTILFTIAQPMEYSRFNHFAFIRDFVNPLFELNAEMILRYNVRTSNLSDYSLNKYASSIFDKALYRGQNKKGVFIGIDDQDMLNDITEIGKLLFFDPILSHNNKRSCASCHKPGQYFTDTTVTTHPVFDRKGSLPRNTPSLINAVQYHLMMADGKHYNLENQTRDVITNPLEMGSTEKEVLEKIMSCQQYRSAFKKFLKNTPQYETVNIEHIASALMMYYSGFSNYYAPFDRAMLREKQVDESVVRGFNLFMGKAQCATCHFVPQFNGTKPPYTGSEFEVIGVPSDTSFTKLSTDPGRYGIHPTPEMMTGFRTNTIRNITHTKPYMHNGVFTTLEEVLDFYDAGGGDGKGLAVPNQTLSADSLKLSKSEKMDIIAFIHSLSEDVPAEKIPVKLPVSGNKALNNRIAGGEY